MGFAEDTIGARIDRDIRFDLHATPEEIEDLAKRRPLHAFMHPSCPIKLWMGLAKRYPCYIRESPTYFLLLMEDPKLLLQLEESVESWVNTTIDSLSWEQQQLFAVACAEGVLPFYEKNHPDDDRPRECLRVRRLFAEGDATPEQWGQCQNTLATILEDRTLLQHESFAIEAAYADDAPSVARYAAYAANASGRGVVPEESRAQLSQAERRRQFDLLCRMRKS